MGYLGSEASKTIMVEAEKTVKVFIDTTNEATPTDYYSKPYPVDVYVDDAYFCTIPREGASGWIDITAGSHKFYAELPTGWKFSFWRQAGPLDTPENPAVLNITEDQAIMIYALPPPAPTHTLIVQSTPVNVPVSLDGTPVGNTPLTLTVEEGEHSVEVPLEVTA